MKRIKTSPKRIDNGVKNLVDIPADELSCHLDDNEKSLKQIFSSCADLILRKLDLYGSTRCIAAYLDVLVDESTWSSGLLHPLMNVPAEYSTPGELIEQLKHRLASVVKPVVVNNWKEAALRIASGEVVLFVESSKTALSFSIRNNLQRQLDEPSSEAVIRGPRIGFIEKLDINIALIRQRIRSPQLKMEKLSIGASTRTGIAIVYLEGRTSQIVVDEIKRRLSGIEMDSILESGYIEESLSDHPHSPFPVIQTTQRPDVVAAALIEGKAAVLVDGSPITLVMPITFWYGFQTIEDYYLNFIFATFLRWLRFLFAFLALTLPSIYVAITTFHSEMIPTGLTLSLAAAREVVPFPAMVETLIMEITFEALREAGIRLPRPVGQTISIVGALVIGQAAVQAGIISAPIIIIVSLTGIASFLIPHPEMNQAVSMLRFPMVICGGTFGLYGVSAAMIAILIHLSTLNSYGVPYLKPITPLEPAGLWDVLIRAPWRIMQKRQRRIRPKMELEKK